MVWARSLGFVAASLLAVAFLPNLGGRFVWDDAPLIQQNTALLEARGFIAIVTQDLWGQATGASSQLYHPVAMSSIWLQTLLFGMRVEPLRLANIAIHAWVVWLFVRLLERHELAPRLARATGLLVLVHPSVCEPVMWITGRHDTLAMVAVLIALSAWPGDEFGAGAPARAFTTGVALALAFLSKEPYVIAPVLLGLHQAASSLRARRPPRLLHAALASVALVPLLAAFGLRRALGISVGSAQLRASLGEHATNYATLVWHYGTQLVSFRNGPTLDRFVPLEAGAVLAVWVLVLLITGLTSAAVWRTRAAPGAVLALFGWLWFLVALAPHVISTPTIGLYGNRYAYCGLFGLAACAAGASTGLALNGERSASLARVALLLMAVGCALRTGVEAARWRDSRTLFAADIERDPENGYALYHLGTAVLSSDGCAAALPLFLRATELAPRYERPWHNAAGCLIELGQATRALPFARHSVALAPYNPRSRYNLAIAWLARHERDEALDQLVIALRLDPHYAAATKARADLIEAGRKPGRAAPAARDTSSSSAEAAARPRTPERATLEASSASTDASARVSAAATP